ncbi:MAG: aminotransferase class V-fold PLP-dependent enzyme [Deltaproteobacteria bacterium]|nr:aminotransferase class V-fold PLP-dependent enzyme [Deltaproteobacteria bacterium]
MSNDNINDIIYLDHNATTPVDPEVKESMRPFLAEAYGNPSSGYPLGVRAKKMLESARAEVADFIHCKNEEVIFTSGGSESNNMVLKG